MSGKCVNALAYGCRVWTEHGLREHGHKKVNVPEKTGGTVGPFPGELFSVKWDSGQESVHYGNELCVIGDARDLPELEDMIIREAVRCRLVLGPQGGTREVTIFLRNGDWANGLYAWRVRLESRVAAANIPVDVEHLARKKPRRSAEDDEEVTAILERLAKNNRRK